MTKVTHQPRTDYGKNFPVEVSGPGESERAHNLATWQAALKAAGGDARRLRREQDGSITILDQPRRIFLVRLCCRLCAASSVYGIPPKEIPRFREIRPPKACISLLVDIDSR